MPRAPSGRSAAPRGDLPVQRLHQEEGSTPPSIPARGQGAVGPSIRLLRGSQIDPRLARLHVGAPVPSSPFSSGQGVFVPQAHLSQRREGGILAGSPTSGDSTSGDGSPLSSELTAEITRLTLYADAQERKVRELQTTVVQLQSALDSRVVIERGVGMIAERFGLALPDAFELLRKAARDSRREVRALAEELLESRGRTPDEINDARP